MPYIICVNQPGCLPEADPTAVATLEEAHEAAMGEIERSWMSASREQIAGPREHVYMADYLKIAATLPESGGTVGPLPDGYVIDVRRVSWDELASLAETEIKAVFDADEHFAEQRRLVDAYNQQ